MALVSALAVNWAYTKEHEAAAAMPPLSPRRPFRSLGLLLGNRGWVIAFATETAGWLVYVAALRLAPLSLVQAVSASGIAVLAMLSVHGHPGRLALPERLAVGIALIGLVLLSLSLVNSTPWMPPPEPGVHSTTPPRRWGGNIDCKELVAGSTLFLPVPVPGALFSAGDGHARQGDGEVSGTAIETPVEAQLTLDLRDDLALQWPVARSPEGWITFGFDEHLDRAATIALEGMLDLMQRELRLDDRRDALALAGVVVDLRVTQVVNEAKGVHAVLRDDAIR